MPNKKKWEAALNEKVQDIESITADFFNESPKDEPKKVVKAAKNEKEDKEPNVVKKAPVSFKKNVRNHIVTMRLSENDYSELLNKVENSSCDSISNYLLSLVKRAK